MTATANGRAARAAPVDLDASLTKTVYPALYKCLDAAFPDFGWVRHGGGWEANRWPAGFEPQVEHKHPDRLRVHADRPWWIKCHGHFGVRFLDHNGGKRPRGRAFFDAVRKLCELAGVACPVQEKELTPRQRELARKREALRAAKEDAVAFCQEALASERGELVCSPKVGPGDMVVQANPVQGGTHGQAPDPGTDPAPLARGGPRPG
jgi:hypothetical protein